MFVPADLTYYIISLGCSKNLVDSERINGEMNSAGFGLAESAEEADIIIINTCGFIRDAKEESIGVILDAVSLKESDTPAERLYMDHGKRSLRDFSRKVAVTGCLTKRYYEEIKSDMPEIDFLYGIPDESFVRDMCVSFGISAPPAARVRRKLYNSYPYSYLKISDGCSNRCSYCAIPLIRGDLRNFPPDEIIRDAEECAANGALELNIIAQDITSYSRDGIDLPGLVDRISRIESVRWIRLLYCHPDKISDKIISLFKENKKVVPYIDIPFQHVNRRILESMGRKGSPEIYGSLVAKLREEIPSIRIRSTFMAGYPGETDDEFRELLGFLEKARLDRVGCFTYSPEEDTSASLLGDDVHADEKQARYDELMSCQQKISGEKLREMIGTEVEVLVEEKIDDNTYIARTCYDAPEVDGVFYLTAGGEHVNTIVRAKVTDSIEYDLIGEII